MEDYYRIMAANGDGGKRVWATEFGWPTTDGMGVGPSPGYEFSQDINQQQQADYIVRAYHGRAVGDTPASCSSGT